MKKSLLSLALLLTLTLVAGCSPDAENVLPATEQPVTEPKTPALTLVADGVSQYTIIRAESAEKLVIDAASKLYTTLSEATGVDLPLQTDWLDSGTSPDDSAYEILIGATNRPQSASAAADLRENEYCICTDGNKLIINGGSDYAIWKGVSHFLETCLNGAAAKGSLALNELPDVRADATADDPPLLIGVTDQKNGRISVYDLSKMTLDIETSLLWTRTTNSLAAGIKFRHVDALGGDVLLYCDGTKAAVIAYPDDKPVWSTNSAAENAHSVELTPDGLLAVASSAGNAIRLFDTATKDRNHYAEVKLEDAHGVLWDPERSVLWGIGSNILTAYTVTRDPLSITEASEYRSILPYGGAHDLAPVYGDTNRLWVTNAGSVYQYNKTTKVFETDYTASNLLNIDSIKGIGSFPDGETWVFTRPDGTFRSWDTSVIHIVRTLDGTPYLIPLKTNVCAFYKVRIWCSDYQ